MSRREMVVLGSRIFALLLASWVFVELTYLPERVATYRHHLTLRSVMATSDSAGWYYLLLIGMNLLRIVVLSWGAIFFWRGGSRVEQLLTPHHMETTD